ncbi:MAG: hypothetical protein MB55_09020 [marine actinobacterium MedAcidi-G3]|nr:MAG: hypothetical protein MB55_09020 [marine actinobacterium MedAcidi-G3]
MRVLSRLLRVLLATLISFMSLALIAQTPAAAADGDLDTSFSGDGWLIQNSHASGEDGWESVQFDASGNVVAGGWWNNNGLPNKHSWAINRVTSTGTCTDATRLDNNCGTQQFFSPRTDHISEILIQDDGKIVAVGSAGTKTDGDGGDHQCTVTRFAADQNFGNKDTSFGTGGKVQPNFNNTKHDWCKGGAIDADGKIVIVGYVKTAAGQFDATIGRLNTDGSWDTSFSGDGKAIEHFDNDDIYQAMAIQADGKIVAVGGSQWGHDAGNVLLARYNTDGSLDTSFGGGDGWQVTDFSNEDRGWDVKIQSNGKIVVAGVADYGGGSLDTSFSGDGKVLVNHGGSTDWYQTLEIQSNQKIIAAGWTNNGGNGNDVAAARFTTAGALDTTFSGDGLVQLDSGNQYADYIHGSSLTPDGQSILLAGAVEGGGQGDHLLVQLAASATTPSVAMAAFGAFRKDGNNSTIATHEDAGVTAVPGGYQAGDSMHASHEKEWDYDVNGSDRTFTLVLGAQPPTNVVFDFTIGAWVGEHDHAAVNTTLGTDLVVKDSGGNTVTQATFTNGNWNTAQTFTVVPVQDNVIEGFENGAIIATVNDAASDDMYGIMSVQKNVVIWDDDHNVTAGFDHVNGAVDGLTLKAFPSEIVMTDYMEPGEQYLIDPRDAVGLRWYCIDPTALANHGGDIGNYIRSLNAAGVWASQNWVGSQIDHDGNTSFWFSQFGNKNWVSLSDMDFPTNQTAVQRYVWGSDGKLRWSDDSEVPNGETGTACTGDDRLYMGFAAKNESDRVAIDKDDEITIRAAADNDPQHTQGTPTIPEGSSTTFDVKLGAPPVNSETVSFSSPYAGASFSPSSITFTNDNYNTAQNVTLSIADNDLEEGTTFGSTVVWAVYGTTGTFAYNITDNDTAAITLSKTTTSVSEAGTTDSFTVVLTTDPATDVDISVVSADTGEATVSAAELAFTTNNWNTPQTVTVTGVNDGAVDGDITHNITLAVIDGQSDDTYDPVSNVIVQNTTADNDSASFTVTQSGGSTGVAESGSTDTFTVSLTAQPATDVVLSVTSGDTGEATVDKAQLTFTNGNWNNAQTVTVTGINDDLDDGNISVTITLAVVDADSHDSYDNVANQTVSTVNTDNDTAGFTIAQSGGATTVTEGATTDDFTLVLNAKPASDVVLSVVSSDTGEVTTGSATVTFTTNNWDTAQTVTLTGVNDDIDDGNVNSTITIAVVDASSSNEFDNVANQTFTVANTDNDDAAFVVTPSATTVPEGTSVTVSVRLQTAPTTNVMIDISTSDATELSLGTVTVTFTAGNWSTTQQVTLTAVDDTDVDGNTNVNVTTAVNDPASDNTYDPLGNQIVAFTVADNDQVVPVDPDFDSDGILNWMEKPGCATLPDCDFDGLLDPDELAQCIKNPDCDDDLIGDGAELWACMLMADCDGDGVNDIDEREAACIQDPKCTLAALDTDKDGINDKDELAQCVNNPDCDGDGVGDAEELLACILMADCDGDGVGDKSERAGCIQSPVCGKSRSDTDGDGLFDSLEYTIHERCVTNRDCDSDGIPDGSETLACILMADCDGDGVSDKYETSKACTQDPKCTPAGLSKEDRELGQLIDLIDR